MANNLGTVYVELSLDDKVYKQKLSETLTSTQATARGIETSWKALGSKSEAVYDSQRKAAENAYTLIKSHVSSTANDIVRAEEAKNAKIKAINEQQFGSQISLLDSLKSNWIAVSAAAIASYMVIQRAYSFGKDIASATNEIEKNSKIVGMSTDEYQRWTFAAKMADVDSQELTKGFRLLSRNMSEAAQSTGTAKNAFSAMGISVNQLGGGLKPLDVMMKEIMDKFAGWADGPQKIALALALFGRSGETLIPLLNKGSAGFEEFAKEAAQLGIILDPKVINAGSKAEDAFKRLDAQINSMKLSLAPAALAFTGLLASMVKDITGFNANPEVKKWWTPIAPGSTETGKSWLSHIFPHYFKPPEAPEDVGAQGYLTPSIKSPAPAPVDWEAIDKRRLSLQKEMLSVGFQTIETKIAELSIDKQLAVLESNKTAEGKQFIPLINQIYEAKVRELKASEMLVDNARFYAAQFAEMIRTSEDWKFDLELAKITGSLKNIKSEEDAILASEWMWGKISDEQYEKKRKLLDITQKQRRVEEELGPSTYGQGAGAFWKWGYEPTTTPEVTDRMKELDLMTQMNSLQRTYLDLQSQHSNNLKDLIANNKALEDIEIDRLERLKGSEPLYEDFYQQQIDLVKKVGQEIRIQMANKEIIDVTTDIARSMSSAWSSGLFDMIKGTVSFADGMKNIFISMGDIIIKKLLEISANYLLMGNITGTSITGGLFGWLGSLFNTTPGVEINPGGYYQKGGSFWTHGPTPIMAGEGGESEFVSITPKSKMGAKDTIINNYYSLNVNAVDAPSFIELCKRSPQGFFQALAKDSRGCGPTRVIIRGA